MPIFSGGETDLTETNPRMWWKQISEYFDLTYQKNLEDFNGRGRTNL